MLGNVAKVVLIIGIWGEAPLVRGQLIIAHRGASYEAPENTLAAFRLAWEQGADGIEGDFYLSSDGQVVCIHDKDTKRVAGQELVVADTPYETLQTLDVGAWKGDRWRGERIPTLEEVIATVPRDGKMFIELKVGPEIVEPMLKIVAASRLRPEQIVVISFDAGAIAACERQMPELRTHWLTGYEKSDAGSWEPTAATVANTVQQIGADGLGSKAVLEFVNQRFLNEYRAIGVDEFHIWTVNDLDAARHYQRLGAWSLTTDRPGWLRNGLERN